VARNAPKAIAARSRRPGAGAMTADPRITIPLDDAGRPDLQALVERAARRYAASIGETYIEDPFRRMEEAPHQGGYPHITAAEWAEYDRAMAAWRTTKAPGKTESGAVERGPFPDIERMYAAQGGRLPCEEPPLIVKDGKYVPYRSDE